MVALLFVVPPVALLAAFVVRARRPGTLTRAVFTAVVLLCALYALAWAAILTDVGDADGFVDCWPHCTLLQNSVGIAVSWSPVLMAALVIVGAYVAMRRT